MSSWKRWSIAAMTAAVLVAAWAAGAQVASQAPGTTRAGGAGKAAPAVATVGPLRIAQDEFEQRAAQSMAEYRARNGSDLPAEVVPIMRRQLLESLIRRDLLTLEAQRRGILGGEREAEAQLKRDPFFLVNGKFDPARFEQARIQNPGLFAQALMSTRQNLGARALLEKIQAEKGPADEALRARATRALARATVDYLALRRSDFDGSYPEPREREVRAFYEAHRADYQRPPRASLSVVFVDQPALGDSEAAIPSVVSEWTTRMRARADSILLVVRGGRSLEEAGATLGGPRPRQVVLADNFPSYWKGATSASSPVFSAPAGTVLPEPVPAQHGWLVVRVDEVEPAHTAALKEVAAEVRGRLRAERSRNSGEEELRALYGQLRDSLAVTGYRVRCAIADTGLVNPGKPRPADLERYYQAHLPDYSFFDGKSGAIAARSLDEVRDVVRVRWLSDRREALSRDLAVRLQQAWSRGQRDAALERRLGVRELGPALPGQPVDSTPVGRLLGDTVSAGALAAGPGIARGPSGWYVFHVHEVVPNHVPAFEQARAELVKRRAAQRATADDAGARQLFARAPERFVGGDVIHYTRAFVPIPDILTVPLTRAEVESFHRTHLDRYSAPELVRARHILISPTDPSPEADVVARARADSVLRRLREGEDFATVAARVTDDPATKDNGGDLGVFGRGAMLPEVERAAFAMRPGDLSATPVKSSVGYHILKVVEYVPMAAQPLKRIYADVSADCAEEKADSLAHHRADSLLVVLTSARQARAVAKRLDMQMLGYTRARGDRRDDPVDLHPYYDRLDALKPGQVLSMTRKLGGMGYAVTWVDSITPPEEPVWEKCRDQAIRIYRSEAGQRALDAKRAELDSLLAAGMAFDSLAAGFAGPQRVEDMAPGQRLPGLGAAGPVDTAVFGLRGNDGLPVGRLSDWITVPSGAVRIRTVALRPPDAPAVAARVENDRRVETERVLSGYFEGLKARFPVRVLDRKLRDTVLPQPPASR